MEKKLERNQHNKMIAGVASGLADYIGVDVTLVRIVFIVFALFGIAEFVYIIMWIAVPEKSFLQEYQDFNTDYKQRDTPFNTDYEAGETFSRSDNEQTSPPVYVKKTTDSGRVVAGLLLIVIGAYFMLAELNILPDWFSIFKFWPAILIVFGIIIILKSGKKKRFEKPPIMNWNENARNEANNKPGDQPLS